MKNLTELLVIFVAAGLGGSAQGNLIQSEITTDAAINDLSVGMLLTFDTTAGDTTRIWSNRYTVPPGGARHFDYVCLQLSPGAAVGTPVRSRETSKGASRSSLGFDLAGTTEVSTIVQLMPGFGFRWIHAADVAEPMSLALTGEVSADGVLLRL